MAQKVSVHSCTVSHTACDLNRLIELCPVCIYPRAAPHILLGAAASALEFCRPRPGPGDRRQTRRAANPGRPLGGSPPSPCEAEPMLDFENDLLVLLSDVA